MHADTNTYTHTHERTRASSAVGASGVGGTGGARCPARAIQRARMPCARHVRQLHTRLKYDTYLVIAHSWRRRRYKYVPFENSFSKLITCRRRRLANWISRIAQAFGIRGARARTFDYRFFAARARARALTSTINRTASHVCFGVRTRALMAIESRPSSARMSTCGVGGVGDSGGNGHHTAPRARMR